MDYIAANGDTTFSSSIEQQCMGIRVVDDKVSESLETFSVNIDTHVNRVVLEPNFTVVEIQDNDGERRSEKWIKGGERGREIVVCWLVSLSVDWEVRRSSPGSIPLVGFSMGFFSGQTFTQGLKIIGEKHAGNL